MPRTIAAGDQGATTVLMHRIHNWAGDLTSRTEPFLPGEDPEDFTTRWTLDDAGRRIGETLPTGGTTHTERDAQGNERFVRDDASNVIFERTYGSEGQLLTETSRLGTITYEYGPGFDERPSSRPTRVTDARGAVTDFTYER